VATQTESEKCLWAVKWLPKAASARYETPAYDMSDLTACANVVDRNELFVTSGANKSLSFYREASGT
jgi:superkiller protein 8